MIKAKIIGAGGYGGVGMAELLHKHPEAELAALVDVEHVGTAISTLYPHLAGMIDQPILDASDAKAREPVDVVFTATPDGVGMTLAPKETADGTKLIDFSGDFRFGDAESYAEYARRIGREPQHASPALLSKSQYGLAELHRDAITPDTQLVGNPGCFAVSCILGLAPAVQRGLIETTGIICDCKTGVSGAGKKPHAVFHYPARYDCMNVYKLAGHQHVCEIEHQLGQLAGQDIVITFTSQVVPLCRGIMSTLYGRLPSAHNVDDIVSIYRAFYRTSPFVRIYAEAHGGGTSAVRGSNYCDLVVSVDARTNTLRIVSHIDNLMKGQAGSALQNMNLLFGLPETTGLQWPGAYP